MNPDTRPAPSERSAREPVVERVRAAGDGAAAQAGFLGWMALLPFRPSFFQQPGTYDRPAPLRGCCPMGGLETSTVTAVAASATIVVAMAVIF